MPQTARSYQSGNASAQILSCLVALALLSACDLTKVSEPDVITPQQLQDSTGALAYRAGALTLFDNNGSQQAALSGVVADEFFDVSGFGEFPSDRLVIPGGYVPSNGITYPYAGLSSTRLTALIAISTLERYARTPTWHIGELFTQLGAVEVFFAENMCSGVPVGTVNGVAPVLGPTLTTSQLLQLALAHFDSAERYDVGNDSIRYFTQVLRARALVDSGAFAAAAAVADSVPLTFRYQLTYPAITNNANAVAYYTSGTSGMSIANRKGENGLDYVSAHDPRVSVASVGVDADNDSVYTLLGDTPASPVTIVSGIEARLIHSEAALNAGQIGDWASTLNILRGTAIQPSMDSLTSDSTTAADATMRTLVTFRERAFWLFGTGHRQGDMRRLVRQYGFALTNVFATGPYPTGGTYGTDVTYTPTREQGNPNFKQCFNRNP